MAPVAAIAAAVLGPTPHAVAASRAPAPIVVTIDPAHGGRPDPAHPTHPFDVGAIALNGLVEKNVDLDVGIRLAKLLRDDLVDVVMTRTSDVYVSPAQRERISIAHHAALVVGIQANASANPRIGGSLVLYPAAASAAFAQTVSDALTAQISVDGTPDGGTRLGDTAWVRNPVPLASVAMGYLSNGVDASLMDTALFRQDVAIGVRDGIEAYLPAIVARRDAIRAWRSSHPGMVAPGSFAPASAVLGGTNGFQFGVVIAWLAAISAAGLVLLFRDAVGRFIVVFVALMVRLIGAVMWLATHVVRRGRRRARVRAGWQAEPEQVRSGSVYDDIPL
ncbi:MAG: N-acetylmuramoyl-L-alanine amidase [Candidatus Dormiibacterota bacterium]